jgi:uncharacterized protein (DUF2235 family)
MTPVRRNLVVLSDGTGNSSAKLFKTNVWRTYEALDLRGGSQLALYDNGVGTASIPFLALLSGAIGAGLRRNVLDLYVFLCRNHRAAGEDGQAEADRIFGFGFSRGAFTIRVLSGLVASQGLVRADDDAELRRLASWAYRRYRRTYNQTGGLVGPMRWVRDVVFSTWDRLRGRKAYDEAPRRKVEIEFLGLFDTVDAYGLPIDELTRGWDTWVWPLSMPNQRLSPSVKRACHALALDDERHTFHPLLWDESGEPACGSSQHIDEERLTQVWFSGMHSDVGGGYPDDTMSLTPLCWMAACAAQRGLGFLGPLGAGGVPQAWIDRARSDAPMHDSRRGLGTSYRYNPRKLQALCHDPEAGVTVARPKIHESVFERVVHGTDDYAPIVLPERFAVVSRTGAVLSGDAAPANHPVEHSTQSQARVKLQERAWDLVWQRRVVYFTAALLALVLVALPISPWRDRLDLLEQPNDLVSIGLGIAGRFLPDFVAPWLEHYRRYPWQLVAGLTAFALLVSRGGALRTAIRSQMRGVFAGLGPVAHPVAPAPDPGGFVYRLRTHPLYQGFMHTLTRRIWPHVFGISALAVLVLGSFLLASRVAFDVLNVAGNVCDAGLASPRAGTGPWDAALHPSTLCHATGITVEEGKRYRIEIALPAAADSDPPEGEYRPGRGTGRWMDRDLRVDSPAGFTSERRPLVLYPAALLRRMHGHQWFVPIAQVGASGTERYSLEDGVREFTARRTAPLFLYVNDAVVPCPSFSCLYGNNSGAPACVRVTPIGPDVQPEPPRCKP